MTKARRRPHNPAQTTDTGPDTPAQRWGAVFQQTKDGRPGERRKYRDHPLETMHRRGVLTEAEKARGMAAVELYEQTQLSPGGLREYVDKTANPDLSTVLQCDAQFAYARAVRGIHPRCLMVYRHVVEQGRVMVALRGCRTNDGERRRQVRLLKWALRDLLV